MKIIRLLTRLELLIPSWLVFLGLMVLSFSLLPAMLVARAEEQKNYVSQKYGFAFQYPLAYDLKVTADCYLYFNKGTETLFCLRIDDRFIEMLYQIVHGPGLVAYRAGGDPYRELAQKARNDKKFFHRYARHEAQNWCTADGPDGSVYCRDIKSERPFTSQNGLDCLELYPLMTREDFTDNSKQQRLVGPIFGVFLPKEDLPLVLIISPRHGDSASPNLVQDMRQIIDSLKMTK